MAIVALHTAATGLSAMSTDIDVTAHNLANVNTTGFKASRANFEDLLYQEKAQPGVENSQGDMRPAGLQVGLGVRVSNTARDFRSGSALETGKPLDLMIEGNGFFAVDIAEEAGSGIGYTRAGNFFVNADGELVLGNADGPRLEPNITIPDDAISVDIAHDGTVSVSTSASPTPTVAGQVQLTAFINPNGLRPIGGNLFVESDASGPPIEANPGESGLGTIIQGFLEGSNVDPVRELIHLIKAQRAFEMNSQSIQAADEALQVVANLRR